MPEQAYTVTVAKDLGDLIPVFVENRRRELENLRAALAARIAEYAEYLARVKVVYE